MVDRFLDIVSGLISLPLWRGIKGGPATWHPKMPHSARRHRRLSCSMRFLCEVQKSVSFFVAFSKKSEKPRSSGNYRRSQIGTQKPQVLSNRKFIYAVVLWRFPVFCFFASGSSSPTLSVSPPRSLPPSSPPSFLSLATPFSFVHSIQKFPLVSFSS